MTIERRIRITTIVLTVFALGSISILFWSSRQVGRGIQRIEANAQIVESAFMLRVLMVEFVNQGSKRSLEQWGKQNKRLGQMLGDEIIAESTDREALRDVRKSYQAVNQLYPRLMDMAASTGTRDQSQDLNTKKMLTSLMYLQLEQLVNGANDLSKATQLLTAKRRNSVQQLIVGLGVSAVFIILINIYLIRKSVIRPLKILSNGAERVGAGNFDYIAEIKSNDEVGKLTQAFNTMVGRLQRRTTDLGKARDELELRVQERTAALETVRTQNELLEAVQRSQMQFISKNNQEQLFGNLLHDLLTLTNSEFGFIDEMLYTEDGRPYVKAQAITDISWDEESRKGYQKFANKEGLEFHHIRGLWGTVILTGEPVISNNPANDPRRSGMPDGHPPLHAFLGLPFHSEDKVIGIAGIANRPGGYDAELVDFLQPYVTTCANIIEAYRNENRRQQAVEQLAQAHADLERKVLDRTAELVLANEQLVREIEERKRAEESVTAERQRLYGVLETLPVYVCLLDSDYRMPFANRHFRETFGEPRGRRCHDFLFDRTGPCETCETYTVMKTRAPHHWHWTGPNARDYDIYDFPFIDKDGSFLILEMGIDITERNQAENALKQTLADLTRSNADLEQFAYVASHDLQEPLRNVAGCMQMLEKGYKAKLGPDADQLMHYAVDSVTRMKALILDLLSYSRISTKGRLPEATDCEKILEQTLSNLRSAIKETGAVVTHDLLPTVMADPAQLVQAFQNLVGNAVKFRSQESPHIHVSAVKDGSEWIFSVQDNGIGVESRHLERIFVIFQRLNKRDEYDGTGMGLAIVKKIVERHRGRIWVESEPGKGTTFYFTIPAKEGIT